VPDVQLLVVAAKSTAPEYLRTQLAQRQFRDAYSALFSGAVPETKMFFQDMGCDGLKQDGENVDILYERGTTQVVFNGDWKQQKMSRSAYDEKMRDAESKYSRMLVLLGAARGTGPRPM
jgi:23S rRNA-/tRNA-specific pseudouridylate synthase